MTDTKTRLLLPALRGNFGDWIYYASLMKCSDFVDRVQFANDIHPNKLLSEWIQRTLEGPRAKKIGAYLQDTPDRFFNSLVLAVYGGDPEWVEIGDVNSPANPAVVEAIQKNGAADVVGFLNLSGRELIFAVDGQHRLSGVRWAIDNGVDISGDLLPVIFISHLRTHAGKIRTRRLFTTLNKTAVPVRKRDIIALDEDDVMAITVRRLIEEPNSAFAPPRIALNTTQNLQPKNTESLTTIGSLYDCLKLLFKQTTGVRRDDKLRFNRPNDQVLDKRFHEAKQFFESLADAFEPIREFLSASNSETVVAKYRTKDGGHLLFRPIGLDIVLRVAIKKAEADNSTIFAALKKIKSIPTKLDAAPFADVIWNVRKKQIVSKEKTLAVDLLLYMLGLYQKNVVDLKALYGKTIGNESAELPKKIAAT